MADTTKFNHNEAELQKELLTLFAQLLVTEIWKFYQSEEGKAYYEKWLKKHPEYAAWYTMEAIDSHIGCFRYIWLSQCKKV